MIKLSVNFKDVRAIGIETHDKCGLQADTIGQDLMDLREEIGPDVMFLIGFPQGLDTG